MAFIQLGIQKGAIKVCLSVGLSLISPSSLENWHIILCVTIRFWDDTVNLWTLYHLLPGRSQTLPPSFYSLSYCIFFLVHFNQPFLVSQQKWHTEKYLVCRSPWMVLCIHPSVMISWGRAVRFVRSPLSHLNICTNGDAQQKQGQVKRATVVPLCPVG